MDTLHDKVSMKQINVGVELKGFEGIDKSKKYLVKSDQKRIQ
jgi:signal transduction histidine kinase